MKVELLKVELLYVENCPNHLRTLALVLESAVELGVVIDLEPVLVRQNDDVVALRFLGSPTVRVDGVDIEPSARSRTDFAFGCRFYGSRGVPARDLVLAALAGER
jgi:hypothetical protein